MVDADKCWCIFGETLDQPFGEVAVATIEAAADNHAANVLPIIREIRKAGATTLREIANALNARGVRTARGGQWYATTVNNVLARA